MQAERDKCTTKKLDKISPVVDAKHYVHFDNHWDYIIYMRC